MLIMNEIAAKLSSKIEFTSVPEKGSHFWFILKIETQISEQINLPVIQINFINNKDHLGVVSKGVSFNWWL